MKRSVVLCVLLMALRGPAAAPVALSSADYFSNRDPVMEALGEVLKEDGGA
jgi:hypothetical protein